MEKDPRQHVQSFWDERADREEEREKKDPRKRVHTDLLWREIWRCMGATSGGEILDAGGGSGRFSIPLAEAGHRVVHLDISPKMLAIAREKSLACGVLPIDFVPGSIDDLSPWRDHQFDLVLCLDSPLSFCFDSYPQALRELVRVTRSHLVLCVMSRAGVIAEGGVNFDLEHFGRLKTVPEVYRTGTLMVTEELRRLKPTLMPSWHAFDPDEIRDLLEEHGCRVQRMSAPGALTRFVDPERLTSLFEDPEAYESYLDFEEGYDSDPYVLGVGASGGGGLLITAEVNP